MSRYRRKHIVPMEFINPDLKSMMDAVKLQKASTAYRHELMLHQQRVNYQNEHDRIDGILHSNSNKLGTSSKHRLELRRDNLQRMIHDDLDPNRA